MRPPPTPLIPSGLLEDCPDVIGRKLLIRCCNGWGWTRSGDGERQEFTDEAIINGEIEVIPERYVEFTTPRCGIMGRIERLPGNYRFKKFLAFIITDGCDFDFTDNIAGAWRIFIGDGELDLDHEWFPILRGGLTLSGYGSVGLDSEALDRWEAKIRPSSMPL